MSKKLIVANWKMHFSPSQATKHLQRLATRIKPNKKVEVVLCPPFIDIQPMWQRIKNNQFSIGAQDLFYIDEGKYTGEVSGPMLSGMAKYVIIGHSERRIHFNETDEIIARKLAAAVRNEIIPVLCVGENLIERQEGETNRVLADKLFADLIMLTGPEIEKIVICYEPNWSISSGDGHGDIAKPDQIATAIAFLRRSIAELYGKQVGTNIQVLYGGSVNADFSKTYLKIKGLDGFLVGGASLNYEEFSRIVADCQVASKQ